MARKASYGTFPSLIAAAPTLAAGTKLRLCDSAQLSHLVVHGTDCYARAEPVSHLVDALALHPEGATDRLRPLESGATFLVIVMLEVLWAEPSMRKRPPENGINQSWFDENENRSDPA